VRTIAVAVSALVALCLGAAPALAAPPDPSHVHPAGTLGLDKTVLVVQVDSARHFAGVRAAAAHGQGTVRQQFADLNTISVGVPSVVAPTLAAVLREQPGVTSVRVAAKRHFVAAPNDQYLARQLPVLDAVRARQAWAVTHGSAGVRIAVIDSGIDVTHPDLADKIVGTYNAVTDSTDLSGMTDYIGHGTFVAGVAAAETNNATGISGAGWDSSILAVKIAEDDADGTISTDAEAAGIRWAVNHGATVINLSIGSPQSDDLETNAIAYAVAHNVVVVAAAGNESTSAKSYPGALPGVIAVGATNGSQRAGFSNYGSWVDVAAPGVGFYSTAPVGGSDDFASGFDYGDGTSFSTPLVAGEVALLKGYRPSTSAADLQTAVVKSAHGFAGLGLGTGQVDFRAALSALRPTTPPAITAPANAAAVSGNVTLRARSAASLVRFTVSGSALNTTVPVRSGVATVSWPSFGFPNGSRTISAAACSTAGLCSGSKSVTVTVKNARPTVTAPASKALVTGSFTLRAKAGGGGLRFYIGGKSVGFDATAPYSVPVTRSLSDGSHSVKVVQCSTSGTRCAGPSSASVGFRSRSLHPRIGAFSPATFSPNKDGRRDTTRATVRVDRRQSVKITVKDAAGRTVRGPLRLGEKTTKFAWTWDGRNNKKHFAKSGVYTVVVNSSHAASTLTLRGIVQRTVKVDRTAPKMSGIAGNGVRLYPVKDGYKDSFTPTVTINERSRLTLTVKNRAGKVVRTMSASKAAGKRSITWNGRTAARKLLPAGTYTWRLTVQDAAGNRRTSPTYIVKVSAKRLLAKTWTKQVDASTSYSYGGTETCAGASPADSSYAHGMWLLNDCDYAVEGTQLAIGYYRFTLPAAVSYSSLRFSAYGYTYYGPAAIRGSFYLPSADDVRITKPVSRGSSGADWVAWSTSAPGVVDASRQVRVALMVSNEYGDPSDFDAKYVSLKVTYKILG
jgi:subtilisin family serine protease/flagellar hook assembly protein FlgD